MSDLNRTMIGASPRVDANRTLMGAPPMVADPVVNATITIKPVQCPVCKTFNPVGLAVCVECGLIFDRALPDDAFGAPSVRLPVLVDENGREHPLRPGENVLGRQGDLVFEDGRVSRRHSRLVLSGATITLEDLGSTNGTKLGGQRLAAGEVRTLTAADEISLGGLILRLSLPGESGKTSLPMGGKTQAIAAAPTVDDAPAWLQGADEKWPLRRGVNAFGRRDGNAIVIADPFVSSRHGEIELTDTEVFLTDIGSTNGTRLNGAKLSPEQRTRLEPSDVIQLGQLEFRIVWANAVP